MSTMPWLSAASASTIAARATCVPSSTARMNRPNASSVRLSEMEKENSPAIVDAMLPP